MVVRLRRVVRPSIVPRHRIGVSVIERVRNDPRARYRLLPHRRRRAVGRLDDRLGRRVDVEDGGVHAHGGPRHGVLSPSSGDEPGRHPGMDDERHDVRTQDHISILEIA
jgi:hypothetical protein